MVFPVTGEKHSFNAVFALDHLLSLFFNFLSLTQMSVEHIFYCIDFTSLAV